MLKTYVSIIDLVFDIAKYTEKGIFTGLNRHIIDKGYIFEVIKEPVSIPSDMETAENEISQNYNTVNTAHPLDILREHMQERTREETFNDSSQAQEENDDMVQVLRYVNPSARFLKINAGYDSVGIKTGENGEVALPYILETEYLKHSDFGFTTAELEVIDQLFALYIREWVTAKKSADLKDEDLTTVEFIINEGTIDVDMIETLRDGGKLINLDINTKTMKQMYQILWRAYQKFGVFEEMSATDRKNMQSMDYGLAKSSIDAFKSIHMKTKSSRLWDKIITSVLYMPIIAVFHLLECNTRTVKAYTIDDYMKYKAMIDPDLLGEYIIHDNGETKPDISQFKNMGYTFGVGGAWATTNGDECFIYKITSHICNRLEKIVSENISIISVNNVKQMLSGGQFQILLNADTLNWGTSSESDPILF